MLLNFGLPTGKPTVTVAPKSNIDINAILGLTPSQYTGLQNVRDTGYFYGNNKMYEKYTPSPSPNYGLGILGYNQPYNNSPFGNLGQGGGGQPSYETITIDGQTFRTIDEDVEGFRKSKKEEPAENVYSYSPSMAYVYSNMPRQTYTPQQISNITSFLPAPTTPANMYSGVSHGAGRFLNAGSLLPAIDYSAPQTVSSSS